jgi:hypothetical protein
MNDIPREFSIKIHANGPDRFRVMIHDKTSDRSMALNSPLFEDRRQMRLALNAFMVNIAYAIRQRCWPNDTLIYDTIDTPHGKRLENPRYPND